MKIVFAPDSFKGTMSSLQVIQILERAASSHFSDLQVVKVPIADGGRNGRGSDHGNGGGV